MAKKLPGIYQSSFSHPINNNKKIFYSYQDNSPLVNNKTIKDNNTNLNTTNKVDIVLKDLFNDIGYVFNIPVEIKTTTKVYNTKIAAKRQNSLLTLDGDVILLTDIISIKRKDR